MRRSLRSSTFGRKDAIFGMDVDEALAYSTSKMVWIRDRYIGLFYYVLVGAVLLYIFAFQILCRNEHFQRKDVRGLTRLWYSPPTLYNCDPLKQGCKSDYKSFTALPYCDEYRGPVKADRAHCEYHGELATIPGGVVNTRLFIPTAVEIITEVQQCEASKANNYSCPDQYRIPEGSDCMHGKYACRNRAGKTDQFFYVADVKNFKVRFTSSFERQWIRGNSLMLPAYVGICGKTVRGHNVTKTWSQRKFTSKHVTCENSDLTLEKIPCEFGVDCGQMKEFDILEDTGIDVAGREMADRMDRIKKDLTGRGKGEAPAPPTLPQLGTRLRRTGRAGGRRQEQTGLRTDGDGDTKHDPDLDWYTAKREYSDNWGDVFTVGRLLQLAGADLDLDHNMDGWTTRQAGTALEVVAVYNNLYPILSSFGYTPVKYHYSVHELVLPYVSKAKLSAVQPPDYPRTRTSEVQYGVLISFKVGGTFGFFSVVYLILMLTAAFALIATATTITDAYFMYVSGQRHNFFHLKYEVSPDFSEMWECPKCGFMNTQQDDTCRGVEKFKCPKTSPVCGQPRPKQKAEEAEEPEEAAAGAAAS